MSGAIPLVPRPLSPWKQDQKCPCCGKWLESPRLLGCLHLVCTPCLNKVENVLRILEKRRGVRGSTIKKFHPKGLNPLGQFLCPVCNTQHVISRLGVSVLPLAANYTQDEERNKMCCPNTLKMEIFCFTCSKELCWECVTASHSNHHMESLVSIRGSMEALLKNTTKEIANRMKTIEADIARIRVAREGDMDNKRKVRREVVTYYEGYVNEVNKHKNNLERKLSMHHENTKNILLKEEVQLEQYRMDLKSLCTQIQNLLSRKNCTETMKLIAPMTKKLEKISVDIMNTGEAIIKKLQFVPKSLSHGDIPGFLSTFSVCHAKSHAIIDRPIYEKALCSIRLFLADDNGLKLDVYKDIKIQAEMTLYDKHANKCDTVKVSVENKDSSYGGDWTLIFTPPSAGIAHLSVMIDGAHIKNSPYVLHVRTLSLDSMFKELGVKNNNLKICKFSI